MPRVADGTSTKSRSRVPDHPAVGGFKTSKETTAMNPRSALSESGGCTVHGQAMFACADSMTAVG